MGELSGKEKLEQIELPPDEDEFLKCGCGIILLITQDEDQIIYCPMCIEKTLDKETEPLRKEELN